jgi:hypothetical protein
MDDQRILGTSDSLHDVLERQKLGAQFRREGRTAEFRDALVAALGRQAQRTHREEIVMRPARWMAGKAGGIVAGVVVAEAKMHCSSVACVATSNGR